MTNIYVMHRVPGMGERTVWEDIPKNDVPFVTIDWHRSTKDYSADRVRRYQVTRYHKNRYGFLNHSDRGWFGSMETAMAAAKKVAAEDTEKGETNVRS